MSDRVLSPRNYVRCPAGERSGARRLAVHVSLLVGTGWLVAISGPWTLLPAMLASAGAGGAVRAGARGDAPTAFASRRANAAVGWLAACPSLLNLHFYAAFHFAHHRHTQLPGQDPELDMELPDTLGALPAAVRPCPTGGCGCW